MWIEILFWVHCALYIVKLPQEGDMICGDSQTISTRELLFSQTTLPVEHFAEDNLGNAKSAPNLFFSPCKLWW